MNQWRTLLRVIKVEKDRVLAAVPGYGSEIYIPLSMFPQKMIPLLCKDYRFAGKVQGDKPDIVSIESSTRTIEQQKQAISRIEQKYAMGD